MKKASKLTFNFWQLFKRQGTGDIASYLYRCFEEHETIIERSILEDDETPICAVCGSETKRIYSAPPISFRGSGWGKDR